MKLLLRIKYFIAFILSVFCLSSCSDSLSEPGIENTGRNLTLIASFHNNYDLTRTVVNSDDGWTNVTFNSPSDVMGFYSATGNLEFPNATGPFSNERMPFQTTAVVNGNTRYVFNTSSMNIDPTQLSNSTVYMYFPYSDSMTSDSGMALRQENGGIEKCMDYLTVRNLTPGNVANGMIVGSITHEFCELIITLGDGFEMQDNPDITVYLNNPYTNVKVMANTNNNGTITSYASRLNYAGNEDASSKDAARQWKAWAGQWNGFKAWFVVLPVTAVDIPEISYIKLKDNSGNVLTVSSFTLDGQSKRLLSGKRIPLTIKNSGLKPTVFPTPIIDWNGDIDITEERGRGINNPTEFGQWIESYNAYVSNPEGDHSDLYKYGNFIENPDGSGTWHFYLNNDIDLVGYTGNKRINEFKDILDGRSEELVDSKFKNHTIAGLSSDNSLIGTLSGTLQNIDFSNWSIMNTSLTSEDYLGVLANTLKGGSLVGCTIEGGYILSSAGVGLLAGEVIGGQISESLFSGFLIGANTADSGYNYLFGKVTEEPTITESEYIEIIFTNFNLP